MELQLIARDLAINHEAAIHLASGLQENLEIHPLPSRWDAAQHFQHLAIFNDAYLLAMTSAADRSRQSGQTHSEGIGMAIFSRIFLKMAEPPVRKWSRINAPAALQPARLPLTESLRNFLGSHERVSAFYAGNQDLDLDRIYFANPYIKVLNFSLSTGLLVIAAHERRHFWTISQGAGGS